jgi:ribose transport system permease protein
MGSRKLLIKIVRNRPLFLGICMAVMFIITSLAFDTFATVPNLRAVLFNMSIDAIVTIGTMILLISGVFDLSVGSMVGFSSAITAILIHHLHFSPLSASLIGILGCILIGAFNGTLIAKVRLNHLIVGLVMWGVVRGIVLVSIGSGITRLPDTFVTVASARFLGLRAPIWYMAIIAVVFAILLNKTAFFRRLFYIGGNAKAAALSGINVGRMRILSFMICGGLAGIAGIVLTAKLGSSIPTLGQGLELRSITACVLGGASLAGGYGGILGAVVGITFMGMINNVMIVARVSTSWQSIVLSATLLGVIMLDAALKKDAAG